MNDIYIDPKIRAVRELHQTLLASDYRSGSIYERLSTQASNIVEGHKAGNNAVTFHIGCWSPDFIGMDAEKIMASTITYSQAKELIAREHGYEDWSVACQLKKVMLDAEFEQAIDAVLAGDVQQVQRKLNEKPSLVNQISQYGHRATLLHYIAANGVESYRQITPLNASEVTRLLIQAGADVNARAEMYGGSTVLQLVATSAHPYHAGVTKEIIGVLERAGAK